jgi:hypothetical protein
VDFPNYNNDLCVGVVSCVSVKKFERNCLAIQIIIFFCSRLSEFENFLLCERILINLTLVKTKRQANFKDFKRFGAFKGLVEQKKVVFNSFVCQLPKKPNLHKNSSNKLLLYEKFNVLL